MEGCDTSAGEPSTVTSDDVYPMWNCLKVRSTDTSVNPTKVIELERHGAIRKAVRGHAKPTSAKSAIATSEMVRPKPAVTKIRGVGWHRAILVDRSPEPLLVGRSH